MADDPKVSTAPQSVRLTRSKDFRVAFTNTFRFRTGAADIGVAFGYQTELPPGSPGAPDQVIIIDEVEVVFTPVMLKLLHLAIGDNIEAIEAATGKPIDLPQGVLDTLAEQRVKIKSDVAAQVGTPKA